MFGLKLLTKVLEEEKPTVDTGRCVRKFLKATCERCVSGCPQGAVQLSNAPRLDEARCDGCGVCTNVCPTGAFALPAANQVASSTSAAFICSQEKIDPASGAQVPCLGMLSEGTLLAATARRNAVVLDVSQCGKCPSKSALAVIERTASRANSILSTLGSRRTVVLSDRVREPGTQAQRSRREFLTYFKGQALKVAAESLDGVLEEASFFTPTPKKDLERVPAKHALLQHQIEALLANSNRSAGARLPFGRPAQPQRCSFCGLCARACPSDALRMKETDETWELTLETRRCLDCKACAEVCPTGSLPYDDRVEAAALVCDQQTILVEVDKRRCASCGCSFADPGPDNLCHTCRKWR